MAIEDVKTPTAFLVNERWKVVQGGKDLKAFLDSFTKRVKDCKSPLIIGYTTINPELANNSAKQNPIKNSK